MSYDNPRIRLEKSLLDNMVAMAEGNPGAIRVLTELATSAEEIDPDSALGPWGPLFSLDNLDCYGPRIWIFYKDVCGSSIHKMMGLMRACQMGIISSRDIIRAIDGDEGAINIPDLLSKLKEQLPAFQITPPEPRT